jgi:hypothetical protein
MELDTQMRVLHVRNRVRRCLAVQKNCLGRLRPRMNVALMLSIIRLAACGVSKRGLCSKWLGIACV